MATAAPTGKSVYLYQLLTLTIDQGNIVARKIFDEAIGNVPLHQFLTQEKKVVKRLRAIKIITKFQYDVLFPPGGNPPPTTADFDLTLVVCLLRNLNACGLNPHFNWSAPPQPGDTSLEADIRRVQMLRNELAHISSTTEIDDVYFNTKWNEIEQVLLRRICSLKDVYPIIQQYMNAYYVRNDAKFPEEIEKGPEIEDDDRISLLAKYNIKAYRPPKEICRFDGRLIKLVQKDIDDLDKNICKQHIGKGASGKVYKCKDSYGGFGMQIAVKKIEIDEDQNSIRREMIMSRILHPFIQPLLAVVRVKIPLRYSEYWMISPFFEKGDLHRAIKNKQIPLIKKDRVKILLQLAIAIQYIHTEVPNVRNVILHKDISSKNVILDAACNARLIDFGLAREIDDQTTDTSGTLGYCHPDFGLKRATVCTDYFKFGVIIREMLTGLSPKGCNDTFLKNMKPEAVLSNLESTIWSSNGNASKLNVIASQCLDCKEWTVNDFKRNVVDKIKKIWEGFNQSKLLDVQNTKCHICMINPKAKTTSMAQEHTANCQQKIEACIACEKYSFLNPITCYCGTKLTSLGGRCGALLIAGNDENERMAEALTGDVMELKKLLTSKAPCIIGISDDNVRMVTPSTHDNPLSNEQELLWPKIKDNVKYFQEQPEIDTLLIYFSGHCASGEGSGDTASSSFKLGSVSESISQAIFEELLNQLDNVDKLIIILDRCHPPKINFKKKDRKVIQINACKEVEPAHMTDKGSHFTKTLIQGLKGMAERRGCSADCQPCQVYFRDCTDFIKVRSIYEYLQTHMNFMNSNEPTLTEHHYGDSNIAYFTDEVVEIEFTDKDNFTQQVVQLEDLQNMEQLQHKLSEAFGKEANYRANVQRNTYRKDNQYEDCDTIEKVMAAWVKRQPLTVKFETI